jgi:hypothetical protein
MMGGKSSGEQTVTPRTEIPGWLDTRLQRGAKTAEQLWRQGLPDYYPGPTVAPFSPDTLAGMNQIRGIAGAGGPAAQQAGTGALLETLTGGRLGGAPGSQIEVGGRALTEAAGGGGYDLGLGGATLADTARGDYLYGGPGFNAALDAATRAVTPRVQSAFGTAGRHRSGLAQEAVGQAVGDRFAQMYGDERSRQMGAGGLLAELGARERAQQLAAAESLTGQYGAERGRQMGALGLAPGFASLAYDPAGRLGAIGGMQEAKTAEEQMDAQRRYEYEALQPQTGFDQYLSRLMGLSAQAPRAQTTTQPLYSNPIAGGFGGGLAGLGAAGQLGAMPMFQAGGAMAGAAPWLAPALGIGGLLAGAFR